MAALSTWSHGRVPAFHVLSAAYCILTFAGPPGQLRAIQIGTKTALIAHRGVNRILEYLVAPLMPSSISTRGPQRCEFPISWTSLTIAAMAFIHRRSAIFRWRNQSIWICLTANDPA